MKVFGFDGVAGCPASGTPELEGPPAAELGSFRTAWDITYTQRRNSLFMGFPSSQESQWQALCVHQDRRRQKRLASDRARIVAVCAGLLPDLHVISIPFLLGGGGKNSKQVTSCGQ
jgi:hypothetical protein